MAAEADSYIARMREALLPMRLALRQLPYLGGDEPNYADHIAWSAFVGFAPILTEPLLEPDDPQQAWLERGMEQAHQAGGILGRHDVYSGSSVSVSFIFHKIAPEFEAPESVPPRSSTLYAHVKVEKGVVDIVVASTGVIEHAEIFDLTKAPYNKTTDIRWSSPRAKYSEQWKCVHWRPPLSAGAIAFAPDGTLLLGDSKAGAIWAYPARAADKVSDVAPFLFADIDQRMADVLGVTRRQFVYNGMAVHPITREPHISPGLKNDGKIEPAVVRVSLTGAITPFDLSAEGTTTHLLSNLPDPAQTFCSRWRVACAIGRLL